VDWQKGQALRDDNVEFYKKVKQAAIEQKKSNRLYQEVRFEKSRKDLRSEARVTRTARKYHLGQNGNAGVVEKRDNACLTVERLPRMIKRGSSRERSFSKKELELAVLTDPQFGGEVLALVDEKVWFPYLLDSGAFTTVVPKSLLKKLKEARSGVVEATLEKDVQMKTAVKDVVTIAKSMIHITVH